MLEPMPEPVLHPGPPGAAVGARTAGTCPATRQERPRGGHHRHEPEDTDRHPDQRWPLGQHRTGDQHQQPDREDHRRDDPSMLRSQLYESTEHSAPYAS
jgi:hypothetical protein